MVFPNLGKNYNFTERWSKSIENEKDQTFSLKRETEITIICFMKLKQFVERRTSIKISSSEQEHKVNALASGAEEGRDKLR